jgi:hypothetical protein
LKPPPDGPLSAASRRLRAQAKKPYRPVEEAPQDPGYLGPGAGHVHASSRGRLAQSAKPPVTTPPPARPQEPDVPVVRPRLLSLEDTARYLSLSRWSVLDLEACGTLTRVELRLPDVRDGRRRPRVRKILYDREDVDRLIEASKRPRPREPNPDRMPG